MPGTSSLAAISTCIDGSAGPRPVPLCSLAPERFKLQLAFPPRTSEQLLRALSLPDDRPRRSGRCAGGSSHVGVCRGAAAGECLSCAYRTQLGLDRVLVARAGSGTTAIVLATARCASRWVVPDKSRPAWVASKPRSCSLSRAIRRRPTGELPSEPGCESPRRTRSRCRVTCALLRGAPAA
jgi:hypothetical protein